MMCAWILFAVLATTASGCEIVGCGDLVEYQKIDTDKKGIMVNIKDAFAHAGQVKKFQFYAGAVDGDERCGDAGPDCWVGRTLKVGIFRRQGNGPCGSFLITSLTSVIAVDGINTVNFDPYLEVEAGDAIGFAWSFYGVASYDYADINDDNLCYCYGENEGALSGVAAELATVNLKVIPDPNDPNPTDLALQFRNSYRKYAFQAEYCGSDCEMIGTGDLVEYQKTDTDNRGIMVDIGSPFPNHGRVKKIQFFAGGVDGDERCGTAGPKCWVGREIYVGIFRPKDSSTCGDFYIPRLKKVTVVDGLNTYDYPAPDYIDVEAGDCVGWAWADYGAISFDFADINDADRSENLAYCYGENTDATSGRAKFQGDVSLIVVPGLGDPLIPTNLDYMFRPSYRKYALQAEFCNCVARADIVFVLDGSGSVGSANFQIMLDFVEDFIDYFTIGENAVRIGVVQYSSYVESPIYLNSYYDEDDLKAAVASISYMGDMTNTKAGILEMHNVQFTDAHGDRPDADDIAIVMTDGKWNDGGDPQSVINDAQADGIEMFAIGIGGNIAENYVQSLSSQPQIEGENYWTTPDFQTLEAIHAKISGEICVYN
jgi:plastocyanin